VRLGPLEAGDAPPAPHGDSHVLRSHIGGALVEIAAEFRNAILRKTTVGAKSNTEIIRWRLMFDAVVSGRLPHSVPSSVRAYNDQGLHLRPSLARSTISQSRDTKCKVDQGRKIAKIGAALFFEAMLPSLSRQSGDSASLI
jgi:hypothetical protein